jgi:hypothetical protein
MKPLSACVIHKVIQLQAPLLVIVLCIRAELPFFVVEFEREGESGWGSFNGRLAVQLCDEGRRQRDKKGKD